MSILKACDCMTGSRLREVKTLRSMRDMLPLGDGHKDEEAGLIVYVRLRLARRISSRSADRSVRQIIPRTNRYWKYRLSWRIFASTRQDRREIPTMRRLAFGVVVDGEKTRHHWTGLHRERVGVTADGLGLGVSGHTVHGADYATF